MSNYLYKQRHFLKISTLSPVAIGDNEAKTLSPYADYVFGDGEYVHILDHDVLDPAVEKADLIDDFVQGIMDGMDNTRSAFHLKTRIVDQLSLDLGALTLRKLKCTPSVDDSVKQVIEPFISSAGAPYIPGSSIKGALRTMMIYHWLKTAMAGYGISNMLKMNLKIKSRVDKNILNSIAPEEQVFGKLRSTFGHHSRHFKVSDTNPGTDRDLKLVACHRIWLDDSHIQNESTIPQLKETLFQEENDFKFSIKFHEDLAKNKDLQFWTEASTDQLFEKINAWSLALIDFELHHINKATPYFFEEELDDLSLFYQNLKNRIQDGECLLRIGNGKTILANTLALILANKGDYSLVKKYFSNFKFKPFEDNRDPEYFPNTRVITMDNQPLGWVRLEMMDVE